MFDCFKAIPNTVNAHFIRVKKKANTLRIPANNDQTEQHIKMKNYFYFVSRQIFGLFYYHDCIFAHYSFYTTKDFTSISIVFFVYADECSFKIYCKATHFCMYFIYV